LHSTFAYVLSALALASPTAGYAATKSEALSESMPAVAEQLPRHAKRDSALIGRFNSAALSGQQIEFLFADGHAAVAQLRKATRDETGAVQSWTGEFVDAPGSVLSVTHTRGTIAGFANYGGRVFELLPTNDGRHVLFEVDGERLPRGDEFQSNHREARRALTVGADATVLTDATGDATVPLADTSLAGTLATTSGAVTVHDVLIYYTAASASKWGQATLESMIRSAVQAANLAYQSSLARVSLNVVGLQPSPVRESSTMSATVNALKSNSTARSTRDSLGADMVLVVNENSDVCGFAQLWYSWSGSTTNWDAYAGAASGCLSTQTLAHEIAHMQQLDHNKESAAGFGPYPYSYGYRVCTSGGFRDIMSYPCSMTVARINYFSNPNLTWNGYAIGNSQSADGARSLNETAATVAAYRPSKTSTITAAPAAPTTLAAITVKYNSVSMSWRDNSTNESGFKVQRSADGVNFANVGTVAAGATSFADTSVGSAKTYYYRVSAYNSAGSSGYSNVLTVKTPGAVPLAPASVVAANGGNGTAIVTWADKSNNESKFEIYRAKWDTATGKWLTRVYVGYVGANGTRFVNSSGKGTFRFYVRAVNSYGASLFAASPVVTVTGG
jgi:hypothetical protein